MGCNSNQERSAELGDFPLLFAVFRPVSQYLQLAASQKALRAVLFVHGICVLFLILVLDPRYSPNSL